MSATIEVVSLASINDAFFVLIQVKVGVAGQATTLPVLQTTSFVFQASPRRGKVESFITLHAAAILIRVKAVVYGWVGIAESAY